MAGTLSALLLLYLAVMIGTAMGQGSTCEEIDMCFEKFNNQATNIGHDRQMFCELVSEEIQCYMASITNCPEETKDHARGKIAHAQNEREQACDACIALSSVALLIVASLTAIFHGRFFS